MITLQPISEENYEKVLKLRASEDLVSPNWHSLAEAYVSLKRAVDKNKMCSAYMPFAILCNEDVVGFAMLNFDDSNYFGSGDFFWLSRLMVDEKHQRKGYGTSAMKLIIDFVKSKPNGCGAKYLYTSYGSNNPEASSIEGTAKTYANLGFVKTGQMLGEEEVVRLELHK
ncbi:MAG: GNAT family N-acetyltransferase [Defluviitaleaceae bacterium]|nr:GNAT family N-acetyltransferase [Defluviitaleaceae bacterium]